jgi:hypothetical protein
MQRQLTSVMYSNKDLLYLVCHSSLSYLLNIKLPDEPFIGAVLCFSHDDTTFFYTTYLCTEKSLFPLLPCLCHAAVSTGSN